LEGQIIYVVDSAGLKNTAFRRIHHAARDHRDAVKNGGGAAAAV
jgi:hypothetical protein